MQLGFNEADAPKSSSLPINLNAKQSIYTQREGMMPNMINIKFN